MLPVNRLTQADNQQATGFKSINQSIQNIPPQPATEINQQVLAKDDIHFNARHAVGTNNVALGEAYPLPQFAYDFVTAVVTMLQVAADFLWCDFFAFARRVSCFPCLGQGCGADLDSSDAVVRTLRSQFATVIDHQCQ